MILRPIRIVKFIKRFLHKVEGATNQDIFQ